MLCALVLCCASACTYTAAGTVIPPVEPPGSLFRPRIEYTTGEFTFARSGSDFVPSTLDGRLLSGEILEAWNHRGYAVAAHYVEDGEFSGKAEYQLTISGSQCNSASFLNELFNALTLAIVPYAIHQEYELHYVLDDKKCGKRYVASVHGDDITYVGLLVVPGLPFAQRGHSATMQQMADNLYHQFWQQGAFEYPCRAPQ